MPWPRVPPGIDGLSLHPRLETLLRRVQAAERAAVGAQRRPTFRLMREILGACLTLGVPGQLLADCLGTSRDSVRNRAAGPNGVVTADLIRWLTDLSPAQLDRLSDTRLDRHSHPAGGGPATYRTVEVMRALLNTPRSGAAPREGPG